MRYHLATDQQLMTIISEDKDIPSDLLQGVVTEMLNRSLLEGLIKRVLMKRFKYIDMASIILQIPEEDVFQLCRMKIVECITEYQSGRSGFLYFASMRLRSFLKDVEKNVKAEKRKVYEHIQSIDVERNEQGESFVDLFQSHMNVEKEVIKKIEFEEKMNQLTPGERAAFKLYLKGYSYREIGEMLSISKAGICRRMEHASIKLTGKRISEFNMQNYKVGA